MLDWMIDNKWILLFYFILIIIIYVKRNKFEFQAKFIALYKTKLGLNLMERISKKYREFIKILGYIGVGIGFIGMIFIFVTLVYLLWGLIFTPETTQGVSLIIPGVRMPNSVFVPFVYGILSIFIIAAIHELAHGIVARAWKIPVLSSGIVFFGPIIGAFVEPDDKKLNRKPDIEQYSVFAAGPFVNIVFAFLMLLILMIGAPMVSNAYYDGVLISNVVNASPAFVAGLPSNVVLESINGYEVNNVKDLNEGLGHIRVGDELTFDYIDNDQSYEKTITVGDKEGNPYIGFYAQANLKYSEDHLGYKIATWFFGDLRKAGLAAWGLLSWLMNLSLAIGLINLLPLGPTDGGRMIYLATKKMFKNGEKIYSHISFTSLMILLACLLLSYAKPLFM